MRGRIAVAALVVVLVVPAATIGGAPRPIAPVPQSSFRAVVVAEPTSTTRPARIVDPSRTATPSRPAVLQPRTVAVVVVRDPEKPRGHGSARGRASWYCNYDDLKRYVWSVCMKVHPDGPGVDLYAAACGKLRRAMGGEDDHYWRGKRVGVTGNGHAVTVRLADWCGSEDKLIDLYRDAMDVLGPSSGGYAVTVTW